MNESKNKLTNELKRYLSYIGKYRFSYWSIFLVTLGTSIALTLLSPYMNKQIFNALEYGDKELFARAAALCILLVALGCLSPYERYFLIRVVRKIVFDIKIRLFDKLMKMDMNYYDSHHSGEALKTLNWDANSLKDSYFSHIYWVSGLLINGVVSIVAMLVYSPALTVISIGFCLVTVFISLLMNREIRRMDKEIQNKITRITERLSDILSGFITLKMFPGSAIVLERFRSENGQAAKEEQEKIKKLAGLEMISFLLGILASFGTISVGAFWAARGKMDYGTVMAVVSLQLDVSSMVQGFGGAFATFSASLVKAGRVFDFLELDCEETGPEEIDYENVNDKNANCGNAKYGKTDCLESGHKMSEKDGMAVEIKNLTFSYDGKSDVLVNFSMDVRHNEKVMIMGESGGGKSTLLKLLLRFYRQSSGEIRLYGRDIGEYPPGRLRKMISYIPQNPYLFEGTVRENIALGYVGEGQVSDEEIRRAAESAYAEEFITMLPQGYDTLIEPGGGNLSGGQRQRIALARAFLKDAPILLLDEPSSALDVRSEKKIQQAMQELTRQKTVLMVTHRSTSFEAFDRIIRV